MSADGEPVCLLPVCLLQAAYTIMGYAFSDAELDCSLHDFMYLASIALHGRLHRGGIPSDIAANESEHCIKFSSSLPNEMQLALRGVCEIGTPVGTAVGLTVLWAVGGMVGAHLQIADVVSPSFCIRPLYPC